MVCLACIDCPGVQRPGPIPHAWTGSSLATVGPPYHPPLNHEAAGSDAGGAIWHPGPCFVGPPDRSDLAAALSWLLCFVALSGACSSMLVRLRCQPAPW